LKGLVMKGNKIRLGVNIDHVATIRNARGGFHPDPVRAAILAQDAGADGITAHLREDRRHITDLDIKSIKENIRVPLNFEMAATDEMLQIALDTLPNAVCLVPEKRQELTTETGLDLAANFDYYQNFINLLQAKQIKVSLFLDPELEYVKLAKELGIDIIEFHTGVFCDHRGVARDKEFQKIQQSCQLAEDFNIEVHAGHGLNYDTAKDIIKITQIRELNIGHFLIGEAVFDGLAYVIEKMQRIINEAS
jgi:pyridoxine 5-phosphate synthase